MINIPVSPASPRLFGSVQSSGRHHHHAAVDGLIAGAGFECGDVQKFDGFIAIILEHPSVEAVCISCGGLSAVGFFILR